MAGFSSYFYLSYLFIAPAVTVPLSIVLSTLVFGLTRYYSTSYTDNSDTLDVVSTLEFNQNISHSVFYEKDNRIQSTVVFVTIFVLLIIISSFSHEQDFQVFTNWKDISVWNIIQLGAAIALCFFIPGFAIVLILTKKYKVNRLLSYLLGYLFSILITGLTAYLSALIFDISTSDSKGLIISVYVSIIVMFLVFYPEYRTNHSIDLRTKNHFYYHFIVNIIKRSYSYFNKRVNECIVFGSLFCLIIILTYYLFGGITIGDQWYHQGRSLLFMSGAFREASITGAEAFYPPFQSAFIASLTILSGIPLVNAYASIAFVNITPVFAFYYFFSAWIPSTMRKAGLLACSLFTISSGFGWIYLLTATTRSDIFSVQSSLETLRNIGHLDFVSASNFVINTAPDFSTGLIYIALPAGFVLLGILRTPYHSTAARVATITAISVLGIISHYEFYIFIIIVSILPIIFNLKPGSYIYLSFLLAFFVVTLINVAAPGAFLSSLKIVGFPLLFLAVSFVTITWIVYLGGPSLLRSLKSRSSHFFSERKFHPHLVRINFHVATLIVSLVAYLYLFSFIVLSQLTMDTIIDHKWNNNITWYLYPMKMGIAGLFGLAFILSYIFKKFEKEVFIFGIIMLVSFMAGPYYDEHRFTKYFMIGMIGFASLMIYEILNHKFTSRPIIRAVIVSTIITSSGLSILTFVGYNSLILQAQDYTNTLYRRHFPTDPDLRLYEFLHNKFDVNSKYNMISFLKEYNRAEDGLLSKITSFAGFPYDKLRQDPLTLNASTIEALYHHLWFSDAGYLIIPKNISNDPIIITESTRFAIEHFTPIYQDNNYIVLEIPSVVPPSSSSDANVALVYDQGKNLQEQRLSNTRLLSYDSKTFNLNSNGSLVNVQKLNQTEVLNLFGSRSDRTISVWAKHITPARVANYIETGFEITSENESKPNQITIQWRETGKSDYYLKLSNDGLELYKKSDTDKKILLKNSEFEKSLSKWYRLKIESLSNSINIYVDDVLKIQAAKTTENNSYGISRIGLTSLYNDVQFAPVKIGTITDARDTHEVATNYYYNYPVTFLALAKLKYETFSNNDLSIFSKGVILVPDYVLSDSVTMNRYLDYARDGGKLIIIKSHGNFSSFVSKVFSLKSNESNKKAFTHIYDDTNQKMSINIPGSVNKINTESLPKSPDIHVIASYRNQKNETMAPFIIEKMFPTGGKILLLNSEGYFNSISKLPNQYFSSLSNIAGLLAIDKPVLSVHENNQLPIQGFVDKLEMSGVVSLNSSSLLLNEGINAFPINASHIIIYNKDGKHPITYNDVSVKDLRLIGDYHVNINFTGQSELPSTSSYRDYIGMQIPTGFNTSIKFAPKGSGSMEIVNQNGSITKSVSLYNDSKIEFYGLKAKTPLNSFPILVKEPQLKVNGHVYIKKAYLHGYLTAPGKLGDGSPIDLQGQLSASFAFVDDFEQPYHNVTKTQYITYLQSLDMDGRLDQDNEDLKLPGDIYFKSKGKLDLITILASPINIVVLSVLIILVIVVSKFLWNKKLQP